MTYIIKQVALENINKWKAMETLDVVKESTNLLMKVILACAFARGNDDPMVNYYEKGRSSVIPLGPSLSRNIGRAVRRELQTHLVLIPELAPYMLSPSDREILFNSKQVRTYVAELIKTRKLEIEKGINKESADLLTILL